MSITMDTTDELLDRVAGLRSTIEAHVDENERTCRLADPVYDALIAAGMYKMMTPASLGGLEMHPCEVYPVIEALAAIDGATGWNVNQSTSVSMLMSAFGGTARDMFTRDPSAPLCSSAFPPAFASRVDGGISVNGRVAFLSGAARAVTGFATAVVVDAGEPVIDPETGAPEVLMMVFPMSDIEVVDVWNPVGMRGTGSNDGVFADCFIPEERCGPFAFPTVRPEEWANPMYGFIPFFGITVHAIVPLGIATAALDETLEIVATKTPNFFDVPLRERTTAHDLLGRCRAEIEAARASIDAVTRRSIEELAATGESLSTDARISVQLAGANAATVSRRVGDTVRSLAGTSAIKSGTSLERRLRDIDTITQHLVLQEGRYASAGVMMLGEPSDLALLNI
ncbi:MAG: acyl-CoA dehydrogenase family protein [Actinomycetota bacterium]